MLKAFLKDENGATAIEYALIAGLIFLACVGAISAVMGSTNGLYTVIDREVGTALSD